MTRKSELGRRLYTQYQRFFSTSLARGSRAKGNGGASWGRWVIIYGDGELVRLRQVPSGYD